MSEFEFPVFDGITGKLMGNLTSSQGQPSASPTFSIPSLNSLPALPTVPGVQTSSNVSPGQTTGTPTAPAASTPTDVWSQYLIRGVVIALGFIFVGVGLALFGKNTNTGQEVIRSIKNHPSLAG